MSPFIFVVTEAKQVNGQQGLALLMIEAKKRPLSLWRGTAGPTLAKQTSPGPALKGESSVSVRGTAVELEQPLKAV